MLKDCELTPKTCKSCGADGNVFSCGGEYEPENCMVTHDLKAFDELPHFLKMPILERKLELAKGGGNSEKKALVAKQPKRGEPAKKGKQKQPPAEPDSDDADDDDSDDNGSTQGSSTTGGTSRVRGSAQAVVPSTFRHPMIARSGALMCRPKQASSASSHETLAPQVDRSD